MTPLSLRVASAPMPAWQSTDRSMTMTAIVQTADDLAALGRDDPEAYRQFLLALLGSSTYRANLAEYPAGYDFLLGPGGGGVCRTCVGGGRGPGGVGTIWLQGAGGG